MATSRYVYILFKSEGEVSSYIHNLTEHNVWYYCIQPFIVSLRRKDYNRSVISHSREMIKVKDGYIAINSGRALKIIRAKVDEK